MTDYRTARVSLGARLRELRGEAGLSGRTLATRAGWHPSKVSRLEHGRQTASTEDLRLWASVCGRPDTADSLVAQRRSLETHYTSWRRRLAAGNQARQQNAIDLESRSRRFRIFETVCVPGILQTPDYARHMISRAVGLHSAPADVEAGVRKRMDRRRFLDDPDKTFQTLLWEPALRMRQCPLDVLTEQLDALADLVEEGKGGIGIVPLSAALTASPMHGFWIYDDDLVLVETISAELCLTDGDAVEPYRRVFAELSRTAVYGGGAEQFIRAVRRSLTTAPSRERSPFSRPEE